MKKAVVIAGNAPSTMAIDYSLLPEEYDVFRCNQFYFEDKYYLGKKVTCAFFNPHILLEQYYTMGLLEERGEYEIDNIILNNIGAIFSRPEHRLIGGGVKLFPKTQLGSENLKQLKKYYEYLMFNEIYHDQHPTAGIQMVANAISMGYKNIYLAGIDLYMGDKKYAFDHKKKGLISKYSGYAQNIARTEVHSEKTDIDALLFLMKEYDVNIYSLCPSSPISEFIPISKEKNSAKFIIEPKKEGYINDVQIPSKLTYYKYNNIPPQPESRNVIILIYRKFRQFAGRCKRKILNK